MFSEMSKSIGHIFNKEQNINNNKSWISQLMYKSFSQGLTMDDIYDCSPSESIETNGKRFDALWQRECHNSNGFRNASLLKVWIDFVKRRVALSTLFYILCLSFGYLSGIVLLRKLLAFIEGPQNSFAVGLFWAFLLAFAEFIRVTCFAIMYAISTQTTVRIGSALHSIIYNKILTTSNICNKRIGEITNLITIDCSKVTHLVNSVPLLVGSPIIIVITFIYSFHLFGVHSIFGALIFVAAVGLQILLANAISKIRKKIITATDDRVSMISETISSIKFVKLCALEGIRNKEAKYLKRCQYLHCINMSLSLMAPITATLITILAHLLFNSKLTAIEAFTLVMLNNIAAQGIRMLPITIRDVIQANISLKRIEKILKQEDECIRQLNFKCSMNAVEFCPNFSSNVNYFNNAPNNINFNFTAVNNKSLSIPHEKLVGVVGNVGCGKTTLLKHMSGEIFSDDVSVNGTIAYLSQQPFLFNDTIRENIVFGLPFNEKKYNEVLHCCGLREDLQSLSDGDCSVVGERALKLSGGQKQRIALSRAVYADRDIYLLDDPLSSLDVNTAQFVFHNCIRQYLRSKTVIMATSQTMFLEHMNSIIYMKDGLLWEYGTHNELLQQSDYSCLISNLCTLGKNNENSTKDVEIENVRSSNSQYSKMCSRRPQMNDTHNKKSDNNDTNQMDSKDVFQIYIKKIGGLNYFIFIVFPFVLFALITNFSQYWLSQWILKLNAVHNQTNSNFTNIKLTEFDELKEKQILENYQIIYGVFIILLILSGIISSFLWTSFALKASKRLHNELLSKILESPVRLFEKTETGTMLHLLSKDTEEVDNQVPRTVSAFLNRFLLVIFNVITVIIVYPLFSIAMSAIIVVFVAIYKMFKEALKDLKRIESTLRSNILSHMCNTFRGLVTIKTFNKQKLFIEKFNILCNNYWAAHYLHLCSMRWMYIRLDLLCVLTTLIASMFAISYKNLVGVSFAALAITLSMQLCNNLQVVVRLACDVETRFTAVERICCFIQNSISEKVEKHHLNCNEWPKYGEISFKNVSMKYDNEYSLALKNITFDVNVNEKIGIVGKTAAGKSSLAAALFRLSDCISGTIVIDGFDTSRLPLRTLRPKITIIPQEVTLLSGTIRFNLDPYRQYTDQQLINALEIVSLKNKVFAIPAALEAFVSESENNFSVGEKRLFYVAKALLQKNKIVVLDEPTNCADLITENIIHKIINDMFENATVLIITHNLRTVLNCDRIFVMDNGTITDIDFPENLIQKNFFIEH